MLIQGKNVAEIVFSSEIFFIEPLNDPYVPIAMRIHNS